eukprot:g1246.t1
MDSPRSTTSSTESRSKLPPGIAELNKEELQKTVQSLLRRLKQRDGQIKDFESRLASISETGVEETGSLQRENESLHLEKASLEESLTESSAQLISSRQHIQDLSNELQELTLRLKTKEQEGTQLVSKIADLTDQQSALLDQVSSLKTAVQSTLEEKEIAINRLSEEKDRNHELEEALNIAQRQLQSSTESTGGGLKEDKETELVIKENYQLQDRVKEMKVELNQHKSALLRLTGQLEAAHQEQRITSQRLGDEQETSNQLRRELQDSLAKSQNSELEMWKKVESMTSEKALVEEKFNIIIQEKEEALRKVEEKLESYQDKQRVHNEELDQVRQTAEAEKERLKKAIGELRRRLDKASSQIKEAEFEKVTLVDTHVAEKDQLRDLISSSEQKLTKLNLELKDYKAKAHLLVKGKDQEIQRLTEEVKMRSENEMELTAMKEKLEDMKGEHERLNEELTQANERFQLHLDGLMGDFHSQLNEKTATILDLQKECDNHQSIIKQWTEKCETLETQLQELQSKETARMNEEMLAEDHMHEKCERLEEELVKLEQEFAGYKRTMDRMSEMQQNEMSRLIQSNLDLRGNRSLEQTELAASEQDLHSLDEGGSTLPPDSFHFEDLMNTRHLRRSDEGSLNESQIVALANKQAEREDTFHSLKKQNDHLQNEVEELEKELQLHKEQEQVLKTALRAADELRLAQSGPPSNMDYQYLKNTVMKLITTGESEALLPVLAKLLNFTDTEVESLTEEIHKSHKNTEELMNTGSLLPSFSVWPW